MDNFTTPAVLDDIFSAQYHLASLCYVNGASSTVDDVRAKGRAVNDLKSAIKYCNRALAKLDEDDD